MPSLNDLRRLWFLNALGLTESTLSTTDLELLFLGGAGFPGKELAYAENATAVVTAAASAAWVDIPGVVIDVPPTTTPVKVSCGLVALVAVSGGGLLQAVIRTSANVNIAAFNRGIVAAQITNFSGTESIGGSIRLAASAVSRQLKLSVGMFRDGGSGLTANVQNGAIAASYASWLEAIQV